MRADRCWRSASTLSRPPPRLACAGQAAFTAAAAAKAKNTFRHTSAGAHGPARTLSSPPRGPAQALREHAVAVAIGVRVNAPPPLRKGRVAPYLSCHERGDLHRRLDQVAPSPAQPDRATRGVEAGAGPAFRRG